MAQRGRANAIAAALERMIGRLDARLDEPPTANDVVPCLMEERAELESLRFEVRELEREIELLSRTEVELQEIRVRLQSIVDEMPIVLWSIDPTGVITLSEGRALNALGLRRGELVGQSVFDIYSAFPEAIDAIRQGLRGAPHAAEVEVGGVWWSNRYFPQVDDDGRVAGLIGLSIDVTEARRMQAEARNLEEQMRHAQKLESLGVLAGGIAHDFNNLLAVIMGNVEMAVRRLDPGSPAESKLRAAERAAVRASELTHQLLVYAGKSRVRFETVDLNGLVEEIAQLLATAIAKGVTIEYALDRAIPAIEADSSQLRQVVMNLITNASDALDGRRGAIHLSTGIASAGAAAVGTVASRPPSVFLEVRDDGVGMDDATLARIFEPFFTTKFTGRGLGLAAVEGIIRGHGGTLAVTSRPGEGTCFRVVLPSKPMAAAPEPVAIPAPIDVDRGSAAGVVLLVDDEEAVRGLVRALLEEAGYGVVEAASGDEALARLRTEGEKFTAAVIDIVMPGMNGHEVHRALHEAGHALPVVLVSGYEQEAPIPIEGDPMAPLVTKPFSSATLLAALRSVCRPPEGASA